MVTLETIELELKQIASEIETIFRKTCTPTSYTLAPDRNFGRLNFHVTVRPDMLDPEILELELPALKRLLVKFNEVRAVERELLRIAQISAAIKPFASFT